MIERTSKLLRYRVLIVDARLANPSSVGGHVVRDLVGEFEARGIEVIGVTMLQHGEAVALADANIDCVFVRWNTAQDEPVSSTTAIDLMRGIRSRNADVPIFLMGERSREHGLDQPTRFATHSSHKH
jgi:arginine decarboxylase